MNQAEPNQFASALAHEVRNPLATIDLAVQMLNSPTKVLDHRLYLDIIMKASGQINDLNHASTLLMPLTPCSRKREN
jgi:signal transduction histidine kinase